jgi:hypothetical protein
VRSLAADLWWIAGPFVAWMLAAAALRELLRPPRHVQRLEARVAKLEDWVVAEHARVMRLDTAVRTVEADVAGVVDELAPTDPPPDTERVPYEGWPNLVVGGVTPTLHETVGEARGFKYAGMWADVAMFEPAPHVPTMELAAVRARRPPAVPTSIPEALALAGRPLTLTLIAGALGRQGWELRDELNDLFQAGRVRFAHTHDTEFSYELETP